MKTFVQGTNKLYLELGSLDVDCLFHTNATLTNLGQTIVLLFWTKDCFSNISNIHKYLKIWCDKKIVFRKSQDSFGQTWSSIRLLFLNLDPLQNNAIVTSYGDSNSFTNYGDLQLIPEVVRHPHFEVPYPQLKRGQQYLGALVAVVRPFRYMYMSFF